MKIFYCLQTVVNIYVLDAYGFYLPLLFLLTDERTHINVAAVFL